MGRNTHSVAGHSNQSYLVCFKPCLGGRCRSLPNGPKGLVCSSELVEIRSRPRNADPGAARRLR
eukprot:15454004-Alexandrium_andersonii.AAC.1